MTDPQDDLELLTDIASTAHPAVAAGRPRRPSLMPLRHTAGGIGAVGVKELRGRMRGRRAFIILTVYLFLLGGFAWMIELIMERAYSSGFGQSAAFASAQIGQVIFAALLMLETLQVVFLAPSATAGAISLEREKQTLELLLATPISSLAFVLGKLLSALVYVWLLIAASIPLTAVVFVYGGVAPEDVVRGYIVLIVTALGFGSFGLFASSLARRTQAATAISVFGVLFLSIGTVFLIIFWQAMASSNDGQGRGAIKGAPPAVLAYLNPFIAQVDVLCGTQTSSEGWCAAEASLLQNTNASAVQSGGNVSVGGPVPPNVIGGPVIDNSGGKVLVPVPAVIGPDITVGGSGVVSGPNVPADVVPFGVVHDSFWPLSVATWLILSMVFILAAVQLVSPTRRWHLRHGRAQRTSA